MNHPHNAGTVVAIDADFLYFIHLQNNHSVEDAEQQIISYIADYAGHGITDLTINIFEQTSITPSQKWTWLGDKYNWKTEDGQPVDYTSDPFVTACRDYYTKGNCDPVEVMIRQARIHGIHPWITFRMNDAHYHQEPSAYLRGSEFYSLNRPGQKVYGNTYPYFDTNFNFEDPEVRSHYLGYIREQALRYDCYGIELDFMREIFCFEYWKKEPAYYCEIMTGFISDVNKILREAEVKFGHQMKLMVRLTRSIAQSRIFGFDAETWVQKGLVDVLVPSSRWESTDSHIPIDQWNALTKGTDVQIYAAQEIFLGRSIFPETVQTTETGKGFAAAAYGQGADKIYLSNFFTTNQTRYRDIWEAVSSPANSHKGVRRHLVTYQEDAMVPMGSTGFKPLPAQVSSAYTIPIHTGSLRKTDRMTLYCDISLQDADCLTVQVNGIAAERTAKQDSAFAHCIQGQLFSYELTGLAGSGAQTVSFAWSGTDSMILHRLEIKIETA